MIRFGEAQDLLGVAAAQDAQGFLVPAPGFKGGEVMRKVRTLHQQCVRAEEWRQGPGQGLPIRRPAGVADGQGNDRGPRAIMGDERQEGLDPMFLGKEGRLGDQRVVEQLAYGAAVGAEASQGGLEVPPGDGKGAPAAGEVVRTEDDNAAIMLALNPGEGLGQEIRSQQVMGDGDAGDFLW